MADVEVGGVEVHVGEPGVVQRAGQEGVHGGVDVFADAGHGGLADPGLVAQGLDELVDLAGGHSFDPGGAAHRVQRLHLVVGQVGIGQEFTDQSRQGRLGSGHRGSLVLGGIWRHPR